MSEDPAPPSDATPVMEAARPEQLAPEIDPTALDQDALKVVLRLREHGHEAYLVGGCVRDLLLGRRPKDFDIATSAHPSEVRAVFRNCRLIGRRFRLAHVYFKGGKIIEVSTFRTTPAMLEERRQLEELPADEGPDGDPEAVDAAEGTEADDLFISDDNVFGTAEEDARRRDFTINGLFYDVAGGRVIDYVRGLRDLRRREIRTIGDPEIRMREDPVRILRAVRFASRLGFDIEARTYAAMEGAVEDLPRCAPARLLEETFRLIRGGAAAPSLRLLVALDAMSLLLPPVHEHLKVFGDEGARTFFSFAEALDRRAQSGESPDDAVLLATLLLPISRSTSVAPTRAPGPEAEAGAGSEDGSEEESQSQSQSDPGSAAAAEPVSGEPAAEAEGPVERERVAPGIEELLSGLVQKARLPRRIAERCRALLIAQRTLSGERRRKGGLARFREHPIFEDALTVFELSVDATGERAELLEAWKTGGAPKLQPHATGGGRPRRRRRRGRPPGPTSPAGSAGH